MPLSPPFNRPSMPFYFGGVLATPVIAELGPDAGTSIPDSVTLDGYTFPVELKEWHSGPEDTFRDTIVGGGQLADDSLFSAKGAWARYKYSWHHGAGQALADLDPASEIFRFRTSFGIDWSTKYQMRLIHSTTNQRTVASATPVVCRSDIYVFASDGTTLYRTTDLTTWTAMTAPGGTINAMTSDGSDLYVATSTGVVKYVGSATVSTAFATPIVIATDNIGFCSGRLLAGQGNVIKEIAAAGGYVSTIKTHFQAAFRWTAIFNVGSRIYVGGFAGSRSELHTVTTDSAGTLVVAQEAAPLPAGEKLRSGLSYVGAVMLLTSNGARFAQVAGDGTLTYGPLIDDLGDTQCAVADGRYIFAGWTTMPGTVARSGVCRMTLDDEVGPLQPAFGSDVFTTTTGAVLGIARLGGRTCFAVASSGIWVESATAFVTTAELESGKIAFGSVEPKALVKLTLVFQPLLAGEAVEARVFNENGVLLGVGIAGAIDQEVLEVDLYGEQVRSVEVRVSISGPGTSTPKLFRWRLRAYPIPPAVLQWVIPLIVKNEVIIGANEGFERSYNMDDMHTWIENLASSRRLTMLRIGARAYRVRVDTFEWRPQSWDVDGFGPQGNLIVQLVAA